METVNITLEHYESMKSELEYLREAKIIHKMYPHTTSLAMGVGIGIMLMSLLTLFDILRP